MPRLELFDSHAHLDCEEFDQDRQELLAHLQGELAGIINPGCDRTSSLQALELANKYDFIYAAVGWHPEAVASMVEADLVQLAAWATEPKVVAIGEIGLDYYYDDGAPKVLQQQRFLEQIEVARHSGLPIIIHDREAHGDMLEIFRHEGKGVQGVFHCYSGSVEMAKELVKLGFYLGFGGSSTFKNAVKVREVLQYVPADRILFETDSPYLTPVPLRGKRNNPGYTELVAQQAAILRGLEFTEMLQISTQNVKNLFLKIK
ncbi:MAG: TatD family hydrolase [Acidaminococcaceae bacterium]